MLNREELARDFIVFILLQLEEEAEELVTIELISLFDTHYETPFYNKTINYIDSINSKINLTGIITKNEFYNNEFPFSNQEIKSLIQYFEDNHFTGYPDGSDGADLLSSSSAIEFSESDIRNYWNSYSQYQCLNKGVYISYYWQKINYLSKKCKNLLDQELCRIQIFKKSIQRFNQETKDELIKTYIEKHKYELLQDISSPDFKFMGFSDRKGYFIDFNKSLIEDLKSGNSDSLNYDFSLPNLEKSVSYLKYQLLIEQLNEVNYLDSENEELQEDFLKYKEENKDYVSYLKSKSLDNDEINTILNLLSNNKFNSSNLRHIEIKKPVDSFRFCFLFFVFDYQFESQNNPLIEINDFKFISSFLRTDLKLEPEQIRKYYKNIETGDFDRSSPFPSDKIIRHLFDNIKILGIDRGNLKPIPSKFLPKSLNV